MRDMTALRQIATPLDRCWTGQPFDNPDAVGEPVATIQTTIGEDASASELSDGIKAIYRLLCTGQETGDGVKGSEPG